MRVLHLISSGGMYGAEAVILNLSRALNRSGHSSVLGIFSNSSNPNLQLHEAAIAAGIESHLIPCHGQIDRAVPSRIRALAAATDADVIHAHGYKADVYAWLAARRTRSPLVSTCHNWIDDGRLVWLYGVVDRWVLRHYQAVVAVSEGVRQRLLGSGISLPRIHAIRNGIDLDLFTGVPPSLRSRGTPEALMVGWVGRLSREKGPDIFLHAVAEIHGEFPQARFLLVGDGPDRADLERIITDLKLASCVELVGRRTDIPAVYASFEIMVSSSRFEGLPMAILEGMASGLPWVATAVGDVATVIHDGQTGLLVAPEDPTALAKALASLLRSADERARLGAAARRLVETEFSATRMADNYRSVYQQAIAIKSLERGETSLSAATGDRR